MGKLEETAEELYIYGLPLVVTEITHWGSDDQGLKHCRKFPDENNKRVVKLNTDTLYSLVWTQLARTPYIVHIPDIQERYYLFPVLDAYTNVFESIGTRTPERSAGDYLLILEGEEIPEGYENYQIIRSRDSLNSILLRIETRGKEDYELVNKLQDQFIVRPLYPEKVAPVPESSGIIPAEYVQKLSAKEFFELFAKLSAENPIREEVYVEKFRKFGYDREQGTLNWNELDEEHQKALEVGKASALKKIQEDRRKDENIYRSNHWAVITGGIGNYGEDYLRRATTALGGWGANLVQDSAYAVAYQDAEGELLTGGNTYLLHINKDEYPHAAVFWSITVYGEPDKFLVKNSINRFAVNSHDLDAGRFRKNEDGSLDVILSSEQPEEQNWLPIPEKGKNFSLALRIYWPDQDTLDGNWTAPYIRKLNRR